MTAAIDRYIELAVNQFVGRWVWLDRVAGAIVGNVLISGVFLMGCVCYVWFRAKEQRNMRAQLDIIREFIGVCISGPLSRGLQLVLNYHARPFNDPTLPFRRPTSVDPEDFNHWSSFPSDHATVYFALAFLVFGRSRRIGTLALASAVFASLPRIYLGYHWPSDIAAGALLGWLCISSAKKLVPINAVRRILSFETCSPAYFNPLALVVSYELANLFDDIRKVGTAAIHILNATGKIPAGG